MRSMHDSILVGINTIVLDDPRLKIQLLPRNHNPPLRPPQPLILDPTLKLPLSARLLSEWNTHKSSTLEVVRQPWLICGEQVDSQRVKDVENAGARVVRVKLDANGEVSPLNDPSLLPDILASLGLRSVMIEGGSRILSSFLHAPKRADGTPLVDRVIVTVGPMFIGDGVGVVPNGEDVALPALKTLHTETMGKDTVMVCCIDE
ncbi:hypothetical protein P7C73_g6103, partial [Tremellales sp. Uapishka_1]